MPTGVLGVGVANDWRAHVLSSCVSLPLLSAGLEGLAPWLALAQNSFMVAQNEPANPLGPFFPAMMAIMLLAYFMFMRPQQQKERQYQEMLKNLKENDHVVTGGGIYGVVTGVQRDAEKVTLRIDEASGVKIKVGMWAIAEVLGDDKEKQTAGKADNTATKTKK